MAAAGTVMVPMGPASTLARSNPSRDAVPKTVTGRVWGTAAGMAPRLIHSWISSIRASWASSAPSCCQR